MIKKKLSSIRDEAWVPLFFLFFIARKLSSIPPVFVPEQNLQLRTCPHVLIVYHICGTNLHNWSVSRSKWPTYAAWCTRDEHNDCYETVPYLNFIIENYYRKPADIIVWAHAHDRSWHYRVNFWDQIEGLIGSEYFETVPMGGVYDVWSWEPRESNWWYKMAFPDMYRGTTMENMTDTFNGSHPCCSSYFFKWELIWTRPKSDYVKLRDQSIKWSRKMSRKWRNPGGVCGRVTEYNWNLMFYRKKVMPTRKQWERQRAAEKKQRWSLGGLL